MGAMSGISSSKRLNWLVEAGSVVLLVLGSFPYARGQTEVLDAMRRGPVNVNPVDLGDGIYFRTEDATLAFKNALENPTWMKQMKDVPRLVREAVSMAMLNPTVHLFRYTWASDGEGVSSVLLVAIILPHFHGTSTNVSPLSEVQSKSVGIVGMMVTKFLTFVKKKKSSNHQLNSPPPPRQSRTFKKPFEGCTRFTLDTVVEVVVQKLVETQVVQLEEEGGGCMFVLVMVVEKKTSEEKAEREEGLLLGGHIYNNVFPHFSQEVKNAMRLYVPKKE